MHSARVLSCAKGQEALPQGQRQCYSWLFGKKWICYVQKRKRWFDLFHYLMKITWCCCCFQIHWSVLQFGILWGMLDSLKTHSPCVGKLSNCSLACVAVFFFFLFCFHPQPVKTLGSAQSYSSAGHTAVLLLSETKGKRCGFGALWCMPSKR